MSSNTLRTVSLSSIGRLLKPARTLAIEYHRLTGKPLGITGELGEYEAARILGLQLTGARQPGFDAVRRGTKFQIKTRCISTHRMKAGQRFGSIRLKHDWDAVLLVLMDENFAVFEIHEANRKAIREALNKPGSKARNVRGALSVSKFKSIGNRLWPRKRGTQKRQDS